MGNWNRRYLPRRRYKYEWEDFPPTPPESHCTQSDFHGSGENSVPSWEIDFCNSARVPWHKVLFSRKYMHCHPSVVKWDDSAGEEAFNMAKKRYWEMMNGIPFENPLPDPDMYIDEIDWNPYIDPELMLDLECQFFNPDNVNEVEKLDTRIQEAISVNAVAQLQEDKAQSHSANAWESHNPLGTVRLTDREPGWGQWDNSSNKKRSDNPWEQNLTHNAESLKEIAWRTSGCESWGWNQGPKPFGQSAGPDDAYGNTWVSGSQNGAREKGWGYMECNSRGWSHWKSNGEESWKWDSFENSWKNKNTVSNGHQRDANWRNDRHGSQGWKQTEYQNNCPKNWDSRRSRRGGRTFDGGCRKRESPVLHTTKFKSSRYQEDRYGNCNRWQQKTQS